MQKLTAIQLNTLLAYYQIRSKRRMSSDVSRSHSSDCFGVSRIPHEWRKSLNVRYRPVAFVAGYSTMGKAGNGLRRRGQVGLLLTLREALFFRAESSHLLAAGQLERVSNVSHRHAARIAISSGSLSTCLAFLAGEKQALSRSGLRFVTSS